MPLHPLSTGIRLILTNENLGFPILELEIASGRGFGAENKVMLALQELTAISATGKSKKGTES